MTERVVYDWTPLAEILKEPNIRDLLLSYWEELSPLKGIVPLDPDWPGFLQREQMGTFRVWTAHVDGTLAGFIAWHILPHLMHRTTLCSFDGGHFVAPAFRDNGRLGYRMWKTTEGGLRDMGVIFASAHDNAKRSLLPFFLSLGWEPRSTMFWKFLG